MATFSENWHTIADLRPRLHEAALVTRHLARGRRWHVLHHPAGESARRLSAAAWDFAGRLDGRATVDQAWRATLDARGDDALTQSEAIDLLGWLAPANLLQFNQDADAERVLRHAARHRRHKRLAQAANPLFFRVPLCSPDCALDALRPAGRRIFSKAGAASAAALAAVGAAVGWARRDDLLADAAAAAADPSAALAVAALLLGLKLLHELAHGLAAKTFGGPHGVGEVRALGVMWLIAAPVPFVDVTPSAAVPCKWRRAAVAAAGIGCDLLAAAALVLAWAWLAPGAGREAAAATAVLLAVGSVLFNANPLVKFDGYFVLADVLELPGLARRSFAYAGHLVKRFAFGLAQSADPSHAPSERPWLLGYALAAGAYRAVLCVAILKLLAGWWPIAGLLLGAATVLGFVVLPALRAARYVAASPELGRRRGRAAGVSLAACGVAAVALGAVPVREWAGADAAARAAAPGVLYPPSIARIEWVADDGAAVAAGQVLAVLRDEALAAELAEARARLGQARLQRRATLADAPALSAGFAEDEAVHAARVGELSRRATELEVRAEHGGHFVRPPLEVGRYVRPGEPMGRVVAPGAVIVEAEVGEALGPRLIAGGAAELRDAAGETTGGTIVSVTPAGERGRFAVRVAPDGDLRDGGGVRASFDLGRRPLAWQWLAALRRALAPRADLKSLG